MHRTNLRTWAGTIVALGVLVVALSAMIIEFRPTFPLVLIGLTLQGITGGVLGPAIAAISLGLVGHSALPERLGRNQRCRHGKSCRSGTHGPDWICLLVPGDIPVGRCAHVTSVCCSLSHSRNRHSLRSLLRSSSSPHARSTRESRPHEAVEKRFVRACRLPILIPAGQRVNVADCRRVPDISGRKPFVPHRIGIDRPAADRCCRDGSLGWTTG